MNVNSHYLWEKGQDMQKNNVSLVLQHVQLLKKQVLFACVCECDSGEEEGAVQSGYFTERMVEWFHQRYLKLFVRGKTLLQATEDLRKEERLVLQELSGNGVKGSCKAKLHFCIVLIKDEQIVLIKKGRCKVFLLNKRFDKKQIKEWKRFDEHGLCCGELQKNISLILCTENFAEHVMKTSLSQVLFLERKATDLQIEKRLKELWQEGEGNIYESSVGVVFLKVS